MNSIISSPSSVADLIGYSVRVVRSNARTFVKILLWPSIVELAGKIIILIGINTLLVSGHGNLLAAAGAIFTCFIGVLIGVGAELFLTLRQLAMFRFLSGYSASFKEAYAFVAERKFLLIVSAVGTYFLSFMAIVFWMLFLAFSMAFVAKKILLFVSVSAVLIGIFGLFMSIILTTLPIMFIVPALAVDERPFSQIVKWSFKTCFVTFWRSMGFASLITIVLVILQLVLNEPPSILSGIEFAQNYLGGHDMAAKVPNLYLQVFASVWRSGANIILSPIAFFSMGFYFLDLRMRQEGLDITRRVESLSKLSADSSSVV